MVASLHTCIAYAAERLAWPDAERTVLLGGGTQHRTHLLKQMYSAKEFVMSFLLNRSVLVLSLVWRASYIPRHQFEYVLLSSGVILFDWDNDNMPPSLWYHCIGSLHKLEWPLMFYSTHEQIGHDTNLFDIQNSRRLLLESPIERLPLDSRGERNDRLFVTVNTTSETQSSQAIWSNNSSCCTGWRYAIPKLFWTGTLLIWPCEVSSWICDIDFRLCYFSNLRPSFYRLRLYRICKPGGSWSRSIYTNSKSIDLNIASADCTSHAIQYICQRSPQRQRMIRSNVARPWLIYVLQSRSSGLIGVQTVPGHMKCKWKIDIEGMCKVLEIY